MEQKQITANYTPLWPTPFGWANLGEDFRELNTKLVNDIETERSFEREQGNQTGKGGTFTNNKLGWQSKNNMEQKYESFAELVPTIQVTISALMHESGISTDIEANVGNLWANMILGRGGYSFPHTHGMGDTLWTGVYYPKGLEYIENLDELEVSETFCYHTMRGGGKLVIRDGNISKGLVKANGPRSSITQSPYDRNFSVNPRESLLVLFPAWVEHMVTPTENDVKRYSISFGAFREPVKKIHTPEVRTVENMEWVTSDSCDDNIKDEVTVEKE